VRTASWSYEDSQLVLILSLPRQWAQCYAIGVLAVFIAAMAAFIAAMAAVWRICLCERYPVRLHVRVRRCFCRSRRCPRRIFAEPLGSLAHSHARRTQRLSDTQVRIGLTLGGHPGVRHTDMISMKTSASTLLRLIRGLPSPEVGAVRVLGPGPGSG
jgi:hypothetical protein